MFKVSVADYICPRKHRLTDISVANFSVPQKQRFQSLKSASQNDKTLHITAAFRFDCIGEKITGIC